LREATRQQTLKWLRTAAAEVNQWPVQEGEEGAQLLECLEYLDQIRDAIRARTREAIHEGEVKIPGWHVEERVVLSLCRDKRGAE
jgi:hypothetical protein